MIALPVIGAFYYNVVTQHNTITKQAIQLIINIDFNGGCGLLAAHVEPLRAIVLSWPSAVNGVSAKRLASNKKHYKVLFLFRTLA